MIIFLYIFGSTMLIFSLASIFAPEIIQRKSFIFYDKLPPWLAGVIAIGFGFILWFSNRATLSPCLVRTLALLSWGKGLFILLAPSEDSQKFISLWQGFSSRAIRIIGLIWFVLSIYLLLRIG